MRKAPDASAVCDKESIKHIIITRIDIFFILFFIAITPIVTPFGERSVAEIMQNVNPSLLLFCNLFVT